MNLSFSTGGSRCASDWAICVSEGRPSGAGADGIVLMFETRFWCLERGSHIKSVCRLNSSNPAGAEAVTVTQRFDIINNRLLTIARAKKVAVKRMYQPLFRDGLFAAYKA